jgi:hypothetical protein
VNAVPQALVQKPIFTGLHGIVLFEREATASVGIESLVYADFRATLQGFAAGRVKVLKDFPKNKRIHLDSVAEPRHIYVVTGKNFGSAPATIKQSLFFLNEQ